MSPTTTQPGQDTLLAERHGIERLRWLEGQWEWPDGIPRNATRMAIIGESATNVEVALALIEELHDALKLYLEVNLPPHIARAASPP
jgi:hypothetical protein